MSRALNALQVAALLISASYGIGFLFGSGELALVHGMAGSIYGVATAVGMLLLTFAAARLWRGGVAVWDLFGQAYGPGMKRVVALLSIVWMAGVLAAQLAGGVAVLRLLGVGASAALVLVLMGVLVASRFGLGLASKVFAVFLLGSGAVLVATLMLGGGGQFYARSPMLFVQDLSTFNPAGVVSIAIAVVALVLTGADYHQFLLAARRPRDATLGCLIAAVALATLSFVPASVVLGLQRQGALGNLVDGKQVIPFALTQAAADLGYAALGAVFLVGLLGAALGSGAAILRAMASALQAASADRAPTHRLWPSMVLLALGALLVLRGQGIVATMVSVNVIYIASIAITFVCLLVGRPLLSGAAVAAMLAGFMASLCSYLMGWGQSMNGQADLVSLLVGLGASVSVLVAKGVHRGSRALRKV